MYIQDLAPYCYNLPKALENVVAVGWLVKEHSFPTKSSSTNFIEKLRAITMRECANPMRGRQICHFCSIYHIQNSTNASEILIPDMEKMEIKLCDNEGVRFLGSAEIWIPNADKNLIFAAPDLIYHYVTEHHYSPPQQFIDAVHSFQLDGSWNGHSKCEELTTAAFR